MIQFIKNYIEKNLFEEFKKAEKNRLFHERCSLFFDKWEEDEKNGKLNAVMDSYVKNNLKTIIFLSCIMKQYPLVWIYTGTQVSKAELEKACEDWEFDNAIKSYYFETLKHIGLGELL